MRVLWNIQLSAEMFCFVYDNSRSEKCQPTVACLWDTFNEYVNPGANALWDDAATLSLEKSANQKDFCEQVTTWKDHKQVMLFHPIQVGSSRGMHTVQRYKRGRYGREVFLLHCDKNLVQTFCNGRSK